MNIKKKLIALSAVLAIFTSFAGAGCSDSGSKTSTADNDKSSAVDATVSNETLSSEEFNDIAKHNLEITPFNPGGTGDVAQDAVEGDNSTADNNTPAGNNDTPAGNNDTPAGNNDTPAGNNDTPAGNNDTPAGNDDEQAGNNDAPAGNNDAPADNDPGSNNADLPDELQVYNGTRTLMQAWWMDISQNEDYVFNGEYLTAEFKIKEGTADGIYPITLDWLDFANWDSETIEFTGIDGAVIVGGEATENKFNEDGTPQVMVQNVSGKAGDTVKVSFYIENNPGVVANILRFGYNSDVLEYVGGGEGADFNGKFK